jgi:hypothetical protein
MVSSEINAIAVKNFFMTRLLNEVVVSPATTARRMAVCVAHQEIGCLEWLEKLYFRIDRMTNFDVLLISWFGSVHESVVTSFINGAAAKKPRRGGAEFGWSYGRTRRTCDPSTWIWLAPTAALAMWWRSQECALRRKLSGVGRHWRRNRPDLAKHHEQLCADERGFKNSAQKGKSPGGEAGARLGLCVTEVTVTNRTVKNTLFLHNRAISEIRLLWHFEHGTNLPQWSVK